MKRENTSQWTAENRGESETSDGMSDVSDVLSLLWPLSPLLHMRSPAASVPSWLVITGAPLSSQHRDDCKTILVGGVQTLRKTQAHSSHSQTRFSIFCIMMLHWDAITSHHKRCLRLTRHLESFRVSLFSIDCHFLSYDRHWQGGVPAWAERLMLHAPITNQISILFSFLLMLFWVFVYFILGPSPARIGEEVWTWPCLPLAYGPGLRRGGRVRPKSQIKIVSRSHRKWCLTFDFK